MKKLDGFRLLKSDMERWKWIIKNQNTGVVIYCDNDSTSARILSNNPDDDEVVYFMDWVGCDSGVFTLLEIMGVKAISV